MSTAWTNSCASSGRAKSYHRQGLLVMVSWMHFILLSRFDVDNYVFTAIIVLLCSLLHFNVCTLFSVLICSVSMCVYTLSILYMWMITTRFKLVLKTDRKWIYIILSPIRD